MVIHAQFSLSGFTIFHILRMTICHHEYLICIFHISFHVLHQLGTLFRSPFFVIFRMPVLFTDFTIYVYAVLLIYKVHDHRTLDAGDGIGNCMLFQSG